MQKMDIRVNDIIDLRTGEVLDAKVVLESNEERLFKIREDLEVAIQLKENYLVCAYCLQNLKLRALQSNMMQMHFAHLHDSDICPIKTDRSLTEEEIRRLKYNGSKESERHKKLKKMIYETLCEDKRFSNPMVEEVIKDITERKKWRKPDIQCEFKDQKIVFELQLSTTFLSVIVSRGLFYEGNGIPLIWILDKFDSEDMRFTDKDIFYSNNSNAFVFDEECYEISKNEKKLKLKVFYRKPDWELNKNKCLMESAIIDIDQIIFEDRQVFYYDYNRELMKIEYANAKVNFFQKLENYEHVKMKADDFGKLLEPFREFKLKVWMKTEEIYTLKDIFCVFFSIRKNKIIGFRYDKLIQLVNHIYDKKKEVFWLLLEFIENGKYEEIVSFDDKKGTFKKRKLEYQKDVNVKKEKMYTEYVHYFFKEIEWSEKLNV
jgi:hypothetical protein